MKFLVITFLAILSLSAKSTEQNSGQELSQEVTATAYTIAEDETKKGHIGVAAWGDRLKPGMKAIAVSRDLIKKGLKHKTEVEIVGMGKFMVLDKMHRRWRNKIDILMTDKASARKWGKRTVTIRWNLSTPSQ
ncbi:3D domain-containing protein [Kangiella shandongensis]|uniref:3D domain-containing protein n=1 Tax=Kangiella shandongensis TaxID=2763258 RepID=UPI001CBAEF7B|nr:3D domain-containing protein [Kangiella shandongensis]